jgi:hypothetical protein
MNGYDLSRAWYNFRYGKKNEVKSIHSELYLFIVDLWNRLGQPKEFGLPTDASMNALGIGSYSTYKKALDCIIQFGFIEEVSAARNQFQSRIIALSKSDKASDKALDKALIKATAETLDETTAETVDSINKQGTINKEQLKREVQSRFTPPSLLDVTNFILEKNYNSVNAKSFWNFYESKNWYVGKNKMKDWKKAIAGWESRNYEKNGKSNNNAGSNANSGYKPATVNTGELIQELTRDAETGNIPGQY